MDVCKNNEIYLNALVQISRYGNIFNLSAEGWFVPIISKMKKINFSLLSPDFIYLFNVWTKGQPCTWREQMSFWMKSVKKGESTVRTIKL